MERVDFKHIPSRAAAFVCSIAALIDYVRRLTSVFCVFNISTKKSFGKDAIDLPWSSWQNKVFRPTQESHATHAAILCLDPQVQMCAVLHKRMAVHKNWHAT